MTAFHRVISLFGFCWVLASLCIAKAADAVPAAATNLVVNGSMEQGLDGWLPLWTRDPGAGTVALDAQMRHGGNQAVRIEHTGEKDWSFTQSAQVDVRSGDIFEISGWVSLRGKGRASLGVVTRDANKQVSNWNFGGRSLRETRDWTPIRGRFIVPPGIVALQLRLIGDGPSTVWLDDVALVRQGRLEDLRNKDLPAESVIENAALQVAFRTADASFAVRDRRTGCGWPQDAGETPLVVLDVKKPGRDQLDLRLLDPSSMHPLDARLRLDGDHRELLVSLRGDGAMEETLAWPAPFATAKGQTFILPVNEGISYPADDPSLSPMHYYLYGGHGLCMPWYGAMAENGTSWMAIVETPDDAAVRIPQRKGLLSLAPEWQAQKGQYGPERVIRYVFLEKGGYVAMAKRYREFARTTGLFKTLAEKRKALPAVDLLVGAVNVWYWDSDAPAICREMQDLGIRRILWSNQCPPEELKALNAMNVLTSRYDIYQDAMNPENYPKLQWIHSDWTSDAWKNDDLMIGPDGEWVRGWEVETKKGAMIPCGTLCDRQALPYAKKRIPPELETHPYRCRFIDTTTASPWRECYHPKHPMTRTESRKYKMELLRYISEGCGLVCGSETGHDAAVPWVHYFEGMLSLGPYRVPDAGRDMMRTWDDIPEQVSRFQTGHTYRLPLWELVYHDCVIAQWYWGDYNNKLPKLWDRRDLWNALYGTPPMFMFNRKTWKANQERFVKSYRAATPVARATAYSEMLSHEWLTPDHSVQRTAFANNVVVTVNFGDSAYRCADGRELPPLASRIEGLATEDENAAR
jgi:hypothetical protein